MYEGQIVDRDDFATPKHGQEVERNVEDVEIQSPGVDWQLDGPLPRYRPAIEGDVGDTAIRDPPLRSIPIAEDEQFVVPRWSAGETTNQVLAIPLVSTLSHTD